ncbi:Selenide, water dikinase [Thelohanellus kitauei]|nr:Selenide, water dikinase [Thelohanellus kitauei]
MLLGGVATSVVDKSELIPFDNAQVGNVLVLTKPLGTRIVGNAFQWYDQKMPRWEKIKHVISTDELKNLYLETGRQMASLNLKAAKEMHNHGANACTDITGFGILGHAENLVSFQKNPVTFSIHTLPLLKYTKEIAEKCEIDFKLIEGYCAETSGGLLICLPEDKAKNFCEKMMREDGSDGAWIIGDVLAGDRKAIISGSPKILTVSPVF